MDLNEKLEQHYVSSFYLQYWKRKNAHGQLGIWVRQGNGKAAFVQGRNALALGDRFYRVEVDDVVRDLMHYKYPKETAEPHVLGLLAQLEPLAAAYAYKAARLPDGERLDVIMTNYLEDKYGDLEAVFSKILAALNKNYMKSMWGSASAQNNTYSTLIGLFATQLFRTRAMRTRLEAQITEMTLVHESGPVVLTASQKDTMLKLIAYAESISLARQLCFDRVSVTIFVAQDEAFFVTSDAPAQGISLEADSAKRFRSFHGAMPLSPKHYMEIRKGPNMPAKIIMLPVPAQMVEFLNAQFLSRNQGDDVYATSAACISPR
jgi:hypothetical protein